METETEIEPSTFRSVASAAADLVKDLRERSRRYETSEPADAEQQAADDDTVSDHAAVNSLGLVLDDVIRQRRGAHGGSPVMLN